MLPLQHSVLMFLTDSLPDEDLETAGAPILVIAAYQGLSKLKFIPRSTEVTTLTG